MSTFSEMFAATSGLGAAYDKGLREYQKRDLLTKIGGALQGGDYAGAAKSAFDAGDPDTGLGLLKLGEAHRQTLLGEKASNDLVNGLSGGGYGGPDAGGPTALGPRADRSTPSFADQNAPSSGYVASLFKRESGGNPNAKAATSSATGLGQFTDGTWRGVMRDHPELGLTADGRTDPEQMTRATNAFTADNEKLLQQSGLPVNDATRYSMHFLGSGGGRRFVAGTMANPDRPATSLVSPQAAAANRGVFYRKDGTAKTAGEVMGDFQRSFGGGGAPAPRQRVASVDVDETGSLQRQLGGLDPRADMPMPGAVPAIGRMPGFDDAAAMPLGISESGRLRQEPTSSDPNARNAPAVPALDVPTLGGSAPDRVMRMPGDASGQVAQAGGGSLPVPADPREAAQMRMVQGLGAGPGRIQALSRAIANPYLPEGPRQLAATMLKSALDDAKMPDGVKEFLWARANGMTQARSPGEYAREAKGPTTLAPGSSVLSADGQSIALTAPDRERENRVSADVEARKAAAAELGLAPGSPGYQAFVLTGKMPREDQQPLTASDKKAILEADDGIATAETAIQNLRQAKQVSKKAYEGPTAGVRGSVTGYFGNEAGLATTDLDNLVTTNALGQLKAIFGAAPTEGERKILLDIQGSSSLPDAARQKIYDRGIALAERRLEMNRQRAGELRGQEFYRPGGGATRPRDGAPSAAGRPDQAPSAGAPPAAAIEHLRANPGLANSFDEKYGPGSAARVFGGR